MDERVSFKIKVTDWLWVYLTRICWYLIAKEIHIMILLEVSVRLKVNFTIHNLVSIFLLNIAWYACVLQIDCLGGNFWETLLEIIMFIYVIWDYWLENNFKMITVILCSFGSSVASLWERKSFGSYGMNLA